MKKNLALFALIPLISCCQKNPDKEIRHFLNSNRPTEIIISACEAGDSGDKQYVPLLLHDLSNPSVSTSLKYKGFSVYTEKMYALEMILKVKPPHPYSGILKEPDSTNIKFYNDLWQKMNKSK